ncbi:MAG: 3-hydroxylacyl-ACP dehydratase [Proteobacteria bacterium]|nr:3-hydroxylacyl-ACP dehydratase [Pseudomonadota bacterium]
MSGAFPPVADVVPHSREAVLVDRIVAADENGIACELVVRPLPRWTHRRGVVPAWLALEYMAQCVAAHAGLRAREQGERPRVGLLLGTRRVSFRGGDFELGERLRIEARHVGGSNQGLVAFACRVLPATAVGAPEARAEGQLNVLLQANESAPRGGPE